MTAESSPQCAVHNDAMEGHQCHGDQGHKGLHWVEFDDGVSEWGDIDELWDEIDRLRAVIENAPHDRACIARVSLHRHDPFSQPACTCWKADAL